LYALAQDYLLRESIQIVVNAKNSDKVSIDKFEDSIEKSHPGRFSKNTRRSLAQNLASSWKQAGFISGRIKNIRVQPKISYYSVSFAFLMANCFGESGDFIFSSFFVKSLSMNESQLRSLAIEASKRDLLQYQFAGNVTAISFTNLFNKLSIDGI
jgi:hypothetical protein